MHIYTCVYAVRLHVCLWLGTVTISIPHPLVVEHGAGLCFSLVLRVQLVPRRSPPRVLTASSFCARCTWHMCIWCAVLHPRFLAELLSPDPELDLLALAEELEEEEGLSILQVSWEREGDR